MHLSSVIIGSVVTEKAERLKATNVHTLKVHPAATKIDVKNALRKYYDVEVANIRVINTVPKRRVIAAGKVMEKRHRAKHMLVTLGKKSKTLDISAMKTS